MKKFIIMFSLTMLACFIAEAGQGYSLERIKRVPYEQTKAGELEKYTRVECIGGYQFAVVIVASNHRSVSVSMVQLYENTEFGMFGMPVKCVKLSDLAIPSDKIKKVLK